VFAVAGFSFSGNGQNTGIAFVRMKDWSERKGAAMRVDAIVGRAMGSLRIKDAMVFAFAPPAVIELGNASGFDLQLQDRGGVGHEALMAARNQMLGMAAQNPLLMAVRPNGRMIRRSTRSPSISRRPQRWACPSTNQQGTQHGMG
jgi:multidrug efflux pump